MRLTFDPFKFICSVFAVLLALGVIPFTPVSVGLIIFGTLFNWELSFNL